MKKLNSYISSADMKEKGRAAYYKMLESVRQGLWSAWSIHQLTTSMPQAYHVAIKRDRKVVTPSFPSIELHHYSASILEIGVSKMVLEGYNIRIYDIERCVCDAIKFRNKIGIDVCSEIIDNYLTRPERNISKLLDYARQLRVGTILENYLQVKL